MSYISMMQLRGIRSFSPGNDENIEFYSPLTMIVGANGCGKTTIIESLKFACTGALPPNTKSGQSMINDPAMTDSAEVKAHIKLRFKNRSSHTCVVTRSLQVTKKKNKLEYKALDAALSTLDLQGRKTSTSMKCSEVDKIIPENLGVSAAILENVIFVHQEDSNWPMQEGMVLKKKFDDIFESTRYTKALEALTKTRKEFQGTVKDIKADLAEYGAHMTTVETHKQELATCKENQEIIDESLTVLAGKIEGNEKKLKKVSAIVEKSREQMSELQKAQWQVQEAERRLQERDRSLEQKLDASDDELQRMINNFEAAMSGKNQELKLHRSNVDNLNAQIARLREEVNKLNAKKGQAELLQEQARVAKEQQVQLAKNLGKKYINAPTVSNEYNLRNMRECQSFLTQERDRIANEMQESVKVVKVQLQDVERSFQQLRGKLQEVEIELKLKGEEDNHILAEWESKRMEASRLSSNRAAVQRAQQEYEAIKQSHDDFFEQFNNKNAELKKSMKDVSDQLHRLTEEIQSDAQMIQEMSLHRSEIANLDATAHHIAAEQSSVHSELSAIFSIHRDISPSLPTDTASLQSVVDNIGRKVSEHDQAWQSSKNELAGLRSSVAAKEALLSQLNSQKLAVQSKDQEVQQLVREMKSIIPVLNEVRGGKILSGAMLDHISLDISPKDLLEAAKITEDEARELLVIAKSGKVFLKRIKKMKQQSPNNCPCCGQGMNESTKETFENKVKLIFSFGDESEQGTVEDHKQVLTIAQDLHEKIKRIYTRYLPLQNLAHEMMTCDLSIADLLKEKLSMQTQMQSTEQQSKDYEGSYVKYSKVLRNLQDLLVKWRAVEQRQEELQERRRRQSQSLLGDFTNMSLDQLEATQRERQEKKDHLQSLKEKYQNEEATLVKRSYQIKNSLSEASQNLTKAQLDGKKAEEIDTLIVKLQTRHEEVEVRKKVLQNDRDRYSRELAEVQMQVNNKKAEMQRFEGKSSERIAVCQQDLDSFSKAIVNIEDLEARYQESNFDTINRSLNETIQAIQQKEQDISLITPKIQLVLNEISSQEHTKRNIAANLDLRMSIIELQSLTEALKYKEAQSGGNAQQIREAEAELVQLNKEREKLLSERDTLKGKIEVHRLRDREIEALLGRAPYKDVEEKHRKKSIEYETTLMAVTDLDNYYTALDGALQTFHTLKIREINKIIRELWQMIYQGQDIDTIELESGVGNDPEAGVVAAPASGSRSYNYRVVMKKGDVPLDMRGRCSAGQKVLAAIVIRLALAETFCLDCGVLALDEPTTNLDEANKIGLAQALTRLIVGRSKQQNFQLVCITHDEDFVGTMRTELAMAKDFNLPEYYFRVYREEEGQSGRFFSHIERIPWEDM